MIIASAFRLCKSHLQLSFGAVGRHHTRRSGYNGDMPL